MCYVAGFVVPVPTGKKDAYKAAATVAQQVFKDYGATRVVECWGDDVPDGKVTDFKRSVQANADEVVVFSWVEWPDKATRDAGQKQVMEDPRMQDPDMTFDGQRMIWGGFDVMLDG